MAHPEFLFQVLQEQLHIAQQQTDVAHARNARGTLISIPKTGKRIASAYEHFRNAAEYAEEHLLLQRAIRRFYMRDIFLGRHQLDHIGEELVIELTQAGYLRNNTISTETADAIRSLAKDALQTYGELRKAGTARDQAITWVLDILSVQTEEMLNPHGQHAAIALMSYHYFLQILPRKKLATTKAENNYYEVSLYIAIHQALLRSDLAIIRHNLITLYNQDTHKTKDFIEFNANLDELFGRTFTQRLRRVVNRYGAPMRVLKELVTERADVAELLHDRHAFLEVYNRQLRQEYNSAKHRLDRGIIKSVIFLFITKVIIGVAVEVPYDLMVLGHISLIPLMLNLLIPPLYIASLKFFIRHPSRANAVALSESIDAILFTSERPSPNSIQIGRRTLSAGARILFGLLFFIPILSIVALLQALQFTIVQGVIFFIFLSTASFLGFRLSRITRELEIIAKPSGFLVAIGDFFYLPFIQIGQWLSGKYARINATSLLLDMAIELPLKNTLRLVRQWTRFLNEKRDELY
jgi:hypothetical protein